MTGSSDDLRDEVVIVQRAGESLSLVVRETVKGDRPADRISVLAPDGTESAFPPFDVSDPDVLGDLDLIPGASVAVQYTFTEGPFGDIDMLQRYEEGRLVEVAASWSGDADVYIEMPFRAYLGLRVGELTMAEALGAGGITGDFELMSVIGGIVGSAPFQAAWRAHVELPRRLLTLAPEGRFEQVRSISA